MYYQVIHTLVCQECKEWLIPRGLSTVIPRYCPPHGDSAFGSIYIVLIFPYYVDYPNFQISSDSS